MYYTVVVHSDRYARWRRTIILRKVSPGQQQRRRIDDDDGRRVTLNIPARAMNGNAGAGGTTKIYTIRSTPQTCWLLQTGLVPCN